MRIAISSMTICACIAAPLGAQWRVETGGGSARLDQLPASSLTAFGGGFDARFGHAHLDFSGNANDHIGLGVAGNMNGGLHYRVDAGAWRLEAGPVGQAARGIGERWTSSLAGDVSAERDLGRVTLRAGLQQGIADNGAQRSSWRRPSLQANIRAGSFLLGTSWQSTFVQDSTLRDNVFFSQLDDRVDTLFRSEVRDIQDLGVTAGWRSGPLAFDARVGRRWGANITPQTWWEGHASLKVAPLVALSLRTGRLASDALLSLRGGRYTTLGLRFELPQREPRSGRSEPAARALTEFVRESPATVRIYFVLPSATRQATLASDLTDWRPVTLARSDDGRWEIALPAATGVYRMNISTDNGPWRVPPGLPATDDGFGAKVGLLVVER